MNPGAPEGLAVPVPLVIFLSGLVPFALFVSEKENKIWKTNSCSQQTQRDNNSSHRSQGLGELIKEKGVILQTKHSFIVLYIFIVKCL